jgi:Transposase DDE domain
VVYEAVVHNQPVVVDGEGSGEGLNNPDFCGQPAGRRESHRAILDGSITNLKETTVATDSMAYDTLDFIDGCRELRVTPQEAQNITNWRGSRIDGRTVNHRGYAVGQRRRKCVEEIFGWMKTVGGGRKLRYIGVERNQLWAEFTTAAYNLVRLAKLLPVTA